jgi:glycine/D-amino acid oxidase-like deaminating enzyme
MHRVQNSEILGGRSGMKSILIVGSGVLGQTTAIRLAQQGHRVTCCEGSISAGDGATTHTLGGIQTGPVYAPRYPSCVEPFKQGVAHFEETFPRGWVVEKPKWYVGLHRDLETLQSRLAEYHIDYRNVRSNELLDVFRLGEHEKFGAVEVPQETVVSGHHVLCGLAQRCKNLGVRFVLGEPVKEVLIDSKSKAVGIRTANGKQFTADTVILAAGVGTPGIVKAIDAKLNPGADRLGQHFWVDHDTLLVTRGVSNPRGTPSLTRAIHSVSTDVVPTLIPARNGHVVIVNSKSDIATGDWSSIAPYQNFVDMSHPAVKYDGPDLKCDPTGRASDETPPLSQIMGPESTGVEGLYIATCGRLTFALAAAKCLADAVTRSDTGPETMRPFLEKVELSTVRMVTPPIWAHGGAIERSQGVQYRDCGTRIFGVKS